MYSTLRTNEINLFDNTEVLSQNSIYHKYHVISNGINNGVNQHFTLESDILN